MTVLVCDRNRKSEMRLRRASAGDDRDDIVRKVIGDSDRRAWVDVKLPDKKSVDDEFPLHQADSTRDRLQLRRRGSLRTLQEQVASSREKRIPAREKSSGL